MLPAKLASSLEPQSRREQARNVATAAFK